MKKLIIAAFAAVGMAVAANAANCMWGYWGAAEDHTGAEFSDGTAFLYVLGNDGAPAFVDGAWNMNGAILAATSGYDADFMGWGVGDWTDIAAINAGTTEGATMQNLAIILTETAGLSTLEGYDGYYAIAMQGQGEQWVVDPTGPTYGVDFETYDTTVAASSWQLAQGSSDVPEPTSGLLLLVGMAGLALRRKQK